MRSKKMSDRSSARLDRHYLDPRLTRLYDLDSPWSPDRQFYVDRAQGSRLRILDVGCGTGLLTTALAEAGHRVTGIDPSPEMLAIARVRPGGGEVTWIEGNAETLPVSGRFDLIVLTGNAFQALLEERQVRSFFARSRESLTPEGTVVFESRNPDLDWESRWDYEIVLETGDEVVRANRRFLGFDGALMKFEFRYVFPSETITTTSRIRFWRPDEIESFAGEAGLNVTEIGGDYEGEPFDRTRSGEMILTLQSV